MPLAQSVGGIVAHTLRFDGFVIKKGETVNDGHVEKLTAAGVSDIVVAQLEEGDVGEDEAAGVLAKAIAGAHVRVEKPFTGRSNLYAERAGVLVIDQGGVDARQRGRRDADGRDAGAVEERRRRRDDRHGEGHSLRRARARAGCRGRRRAQGVHYASRRSGR